MSPVYLPCVLKALVAAFKQLNTPSSGSVIEFSLLSDICQLYNPGDSLFLYMSLHMNKVMLQSYISYVHTTFLWSSEKGTSPVTCDPIWDLIN
jgi:hypothetical protein